MAKYRTFTRNWWKKAGDKLEPEIGEKKYTGQVYDTEAEARQACQEANLTREYRNHPLGKKMEYEAF